jgi:hypothetical protein
MEIFIVLLHIIQSFAISLGVGCSTLAVINFFVAIADGKIDETERKMMGITYITLRVAMVAIMITTCVITAYGIQTRGLEAITLYTIAQFILIFVLYTNAVLMTLRIMPSTFGPAIQAGSWYSLGTLAALVPLELTDFTFTQFMLSYIAVLTLAVSLINGTMALLKRHKAQKSSVPPVAT